MKSWQLTVSIRFTNYGLMGGGGGGLIAFWFEMADIAIV
jgi:hypothetical protein